VWWRHLRAAALGLRVRLKALLQVQSKAQQPAKQPVLLTALQPTPQTQALRVVPLAQKLQQWGSKPGRRTARVGGKTAGVCACTDCGVWPRQRAGSPR
jgi:hypothetical protein